MPDCEVRVIKQMDAASVAAWNLFWLSTPGIDNVPNSGRNWHKGYTPRPGVLSAIVSDVTFDPVLALKLCMHPSQFLEWFERTDLSDYTTYDVLDGDPWIATVVRRARMAEERMKHEVTQAFSPVRDGNVYQIDFMRSRA